MKRIIFVIVSFLITTYAYCQRKVLYLRCDEKINIGRDTVYINFQKKQLYLVTKSGFKYNLKKASEADADIECYEDGRAHYHGNYERGPCCNFYIKMNEPMKLYFDDNSVVYLYRSHTDHASHMSHTSHASHYSSRL